MIVQGRLLHTAGECLPAATLACRHCCRPPPAPAPALLLCSSPSAIQPAASQQEMAGRQQPSAWDVSLRSPAARYLTVDGTRARYIGPGSDDRDAAAVRANHPVPSDCPLYYFEVEITSRGRDGFIGAGWLVQGQWPGVGGGSCSLWLWHAQQLGVCVHPCLIGSLIHLHTL